MKENRFIELLNLYVDHQIGPEEAADLEAEIDRRPERRKTYEDYCRLQRACGLLFDRERQKAPASFLLEKSLRETEWKISNFPARRKIGWGTYMAGFAGATAMAACLAVMLLRLGTASFQNDRNVAVAPLAKTSSPFIAQSAPSLIQTASLTPRGSGFQPVFASDNFTASRDEATSSERTDTEWMQQVQLQPVQHMLVDDLTFETKPTLQQDNRVFRSSRPIQGNIEFTAFQFQR